MLVPTQCSLAVTNVRILDYINKLNKNLENSKIVTIFDAELCTIR